MLTLGLINDYSRPIEVRPPAPVVKRPDTQPDTAESASFLGAGALNRSRNRDLVAKQQMKTVETVEVVAHVLKPRASSRLRSTGPANTAEIARLAYHLWQSRGCPEGSPEVDWLQAEQQLSERIEASRPRTVRGSIRVSTSSAAKSPRAGSRSRTTAR